MDLLEYAKRVAKRPSLRNIQFTVQRFWYQAQTVIGNETRTDPTVAAVLSQIVLFTKEFSKALERHQLDPNNDSSREVILLRGFAWSDYVLLVADDGFDGKALERDGVRLENRVLSR